MYTQQQKGDSHQKLKPNQKKDDKKVTTNYNVEAGTTFHSTKVIVSKICVMSSIKLFHYDL